MVNAPKRRKKGNLNAESRTKGRNEEESQEKLHKITREKECLLY